MEGENKPTIYTYGDSHCWHVWLKVPNTIVLYSGPMTMHNFNNLKPKMENVPKDSILCLSFGEIDCRCCINKYQPWEKSIDDLVSEYLSVIRSNIRHDKIWIFNVVPPPRKKNVIESPSFPFIGTDDERLSYVLRVNDKLRNSGFVFVDVYDKYMDEDGFLKMELSDGNVHIAEPKFLFEWISEHR